MENTLEKQNYKNFVLIGRPNVGKSSIINFLLRKKEAKVKNEDGTTQDWREIKFEGFSIWDTPGVFKLDKMPPCDVYKVIFVVENNILESDKELYKKIRREYSVSVVVNKVDKSEEDYSFFHDYTKISAMKNYNLEGLLEILEEKKLRQKMSEKKLWAFIGKPNVGKSSIINMLFKEERLNVADEEGTTKEFIALANDDFNLLDSPGQRGGIDFPKYSDIFGLIIVLDLKQEKQDLKIIDFVSKRKKPLIVVINKVDLDERGKMAEIQDKIKRYWGIKCVQVSCVRKTGIKSLKNSMALVEENYFKRIKTNALNVWVKDRVRPIEPKIKYLTQISTGHPKFYVDTRLVEDKKRMLINKIRNDFEFHGVPIDLVMKEDKKDKS